LTIVAVDPGWPRRGLARERARIANNWLGFPGSTLVDNLRLRDIPAGGRR
jgi:hypothetical protein